MPVLQELNAVVERASCPFPAKAKGFSASHFLVSRGAHFVCVVPVSTAEQSMISLVNSMEIKKIRGNLAKIFLSTSLLLLAASSVF